MSNFAYYLLWLAGGLVIIAVASAMIARHLRMRLLRRLKAVEAMDALGRYSQWVAAQRQGTLLHAESRDSDQALGELRAGAQQWFPELRVEAQVLFAVHAALAEFLDSQLALRMQDPEAWLESDHDARFLEHWRQNLAAARALADGLARIAGMHDLRGEGFPA